MITTKLITKIYGSIAMVINDSNQIDNCNHRPVNMGINNDYNQIDNYSYCSIVIVINSDSNPIDVYNYRSMTMTVVC